MFKDKVVLITGGTGSFGKEFSGELLDKYDFKKIIILSLCMSQQVASMFTNQHMIGNHSRRSWKNKKIL